MTFAPARNRDPIVQHGDGADRRAPDAHHDDGNGAARTKTVTEFYSAVVWELRKQIIDIGLTMEQCDELSGLECGYAAKLLHPNTPSGRQAGYVRVQYLMDVLFCCGGFVMTIKPRASIERIRAEINRKLERRGSKLNPFGIAKSARLRGVVGKTAIRDFARYAGRKGGAKRREMPEKKRIALARKAARARWWRKPTVTEIAG